MANQVRFNVGFDINSSELNKIKSSLQEIQKLTATAFSQANANTTFTNVNEELARIKSTASTVETALTKAFNPKLNTINVSTFNNELKTAKLSVEQIYQDFSKAGTAGQVGFQRLATSVLTANTELKQTKTILDEMATTLSNSVKWNLASGAINKLTGSVQQAYGYVKSLDGSLNDIMIVTQKSADEMDKFAEKANKAAKSLGITTTDYTKSALTFYQQGLSDEEVEARTDLTNKVANASGLDADDAAEYVTAVLNGYKVGSEEAESAMDVLANVGAHTASSLSELSEAMSKVASTASTMGVSEEQLAASLATVIQTTRQDASTVGTAFKTIYMRISDIEAGTEDAEVSLGTYTGKMKELGINVLDETGNLRDLGEVMEEVGNGWEDMSREQQIALARTMAGTRQANNLLALFDNWDDYADALGYASNATGTLQQQQDTYMESTEAHLNKLKASEEDLFDSLLDSSTVNGFADALSGITDFISNWVDALGGGGKALLALGSIGVSVFSNQIGKGLGTMINNTVKAKENIKDIATQMALIPEFKALGNNNITQLAEMKEQIISYGALVTDEQMQEANGYIQEKAALLEKRQALEQTQNVATAFLQQVADANQTSFVDIFNIADSEQFEEQCANAELALEQVLDKASIGKEDFKDLANAIKIAQAAFRAESGAAKDNVDVQQASADAADSLKSKFVAQKDAIRAISSLLDQSSSEYKNLKSAIEAVFEAISTHTGYDKAFEKFTNAYNQAQTKIQEGASTARQAMDNVSTGAIQSVEKELTGFQARWETFKNDLNTQEFVKGLSKTVGGVGQLTSALMTLSNIKDTLENDDLSTFDKTLQIIQQATTGITMLATGLGSLTSGISGIIKGAPGIANFFTTLVAGEEAGTAGGITLQAALWEITLIAAAVAAVIGVIVGVSVSLVKAWNADADAAKAASERVSELTDRYTELDEAAQTLKDNISDYQDAIEELDSLTQGTDEFKTALEEANEKAKELIETYKLFDSYTIDNNGLIQIDSNALDAAVASAEQSAKLVEQELNAANIISNTASMKNQGTQIARSIGSLTTSVPIDYNGNRTVISDYLSSSQVQGVALAIQKALENGPLSDQALEEALLANSDFTSLGEIVTQNVDALIANREQLEAYADSLSEAAEANRYYAQQIVGNEISDNYSGQINAIATNTDGTVDEGLVAQIVSAVTGTISQGTSLEDQIAAIDVSGVKSNNALNKILTANNQSAINNNTDLALAYAEMLGYDTTGAIVKHSGSKSTVTDASGNTIIDKVSNNDMRQALARQAKIDAITEQYVNDLGPATENFINSLDGTIKASDDFGEQFGADFTSAILNNLANGEDGTFDLSSVFQDLDPDEIAQLTGMSGDELATALGLTDEQLTALGFNSADEFGLAFQQELQNYDVTDYWQGQISQADSNISILGTALSKAQSGDDLSDDELAELETLKEKYADYFEGLQEGSHEYLEALREIREQEEDNKIEALEGLKETQEARRDELQAEIEQLEQEKEAALTDDEKADFQLQIDADTTELDSVLEEIQGTDYSIDVQINADLASDVDNAFGLASEFDALQDKITDSFQVTYDEAQQLIADGYGAMLQNATTTTDGLIQLNATTVNSFIDGKQAELEADKEEKTAELQNQRAMLVTQLETLQKKQAALAEARAADTADEKQAGLAKAMLYEAEYEAERQQLEAELESEDEKTSKMSEMQADLYNALSTMYDTDSQNEQNAAQASDDAQRQLQTNVINYYNAMQRAVIAFNQAVASGTTTYNGVTGVSGGGINGRSTGQTTTSSTYGFHKNDITSAIGDLTAGFKAEDYNAVIDQLADDTQSQINSVQNQIGAIDAAIAAMNTASASLNNRQATAGNSGNSSSGNNSGSSSSSEAEQIDLLSDEADIYHDIDIEIQQLEDDLSKLQKTEDTLFGKELIDNLNEQLEILEKQRDAIADKIELAKMEAGAYKTELASYGATFDAQTGEITNYYALMESALEEANAAIARYNNLSASAQTDAEKDKVEAAKTKYETVKSAVESYENIINNTIPDLEDQITDTLMDEIEIKIKEFDMSVEIHLDMSEAERDWNEFKRKIIDELDDDNLLGSAQQDLNDIFSYYNTNNSGTGSVQAETDRVNTILAELQKIANGGHSDIYSAYDATTDTWVDDTATAMEDLQEGYEEIMSELEDIDKLEESIEDTFLDSIDAVKDAYDAQEELYEFIGDQIEHDLKMIELLYGDAAYDKMEAYYQKQVESDKAQIANLQSQANYWKQMMDAAREAGDDEAYEQYKDNWSDTLDSLNDKIETWADDLANKYSNTIQKIITDLNNALTDFKGLDYIDEELDLLNDNAENYLDTINAAYAVQDLQNKWQDAINDTDSISAQEKLNSLMQEQMNMLEQKGELTQYDIDRAEKEYEIAVKQIALQEAQQNKSKMRLKRDANGNYSYQFVSDEDSVRDAQEELAQLQNELYNFDKSAYQDNLNEMYSVWEEFQSKVTDVMEDADLTDEQRQEKIALLYEKYGEKINYLTEQNANIRNNLEESAFDSLAQMYNTDISNFQNMSDEEKNILMNDLIPQWDSGVQEMIDKFSGSGGFEDLCQESFDNLGQAAQEYENEQNNIAQVVSDTNQQIEEEQLVLQEESNAAVEAAQQELEAVEAIRDQVQGLAADYKAAKQAAVEASQAAYTYWQEEQQRAAAEAAKNSSSASSTTTTTSSTDTTSTTPTTSTTTTTSTPSTSTSSSSKTASADVIKGIAAAIWCEGNSGWGNDPGRKQKLIAKFNEATRNQVQSYINAHANNGDLYRYWVNTLHKNASAYHYDKFKQGGLATNTGFAWLDGTASSPEMVLNADDTENMLSALSILNNIVSTLGSSTLNTIAERLGNIGTTISQGSSDSLEQQVYITATFEGQTEANQIQTALNNLVNIASQRAYRSTK